MLKFTIKLFSLILCSHTLFAQNQVIVDSLLKITKSNISDNKKVNTYVALARSYSSSNSANTLKYANSAIELANKINYLKGEIDALNEIALVMMRKGKYPKAKELFRQIIKHAKKIKYPKGEFKGLRGLGSFYNHNGEQEKALEYYLQSLEISKKIGNKKGLSNTYNEIGVIYGKLGKYEKALEYFFKTLEIAKNIGEQQLISSAYGNIGLMYQYQGRYKEALEYHSQSLEIAKELKKIRGMLAAYSNMGMIYEQQGNYEKALEYHFQALKIREELGDKKGIAISYNNIGIVYKRWGDNEKALNYYLKSLEIYEALEYKRGMSGAYGNIGNIYKEKNAYEKSLEYHFKSLGIDKEIGNKIGISITYENIGNVYLMQIDYEKALDYYFKSLKIAEDMGAKADMSYPLISIGEAYMKQNQWRLAQKYLSQSFQIAQEVGLTENIRNAAKLLSEVEKELGDYKAAYEYQILFKAMADSLKNEEQVEKITRLEMNYEFEQEKDSIQFANESERIILEKDIEKRRLTQIATYSGLALLGVLLLVLYLFLRSKNISNKLLTEQSNELKQANTEIKTANQEILSSIVYAQRIQNSILPRPEYIQSLLPEHFIFFKPRDVVSGDFYYLAEVENKIILSAIDCTGHGVPGAFMSMVGNDLLNNIIKEHHIHEPNKILYHLHKGIRQALQQDKNTSQDGMEMALVCIDKSSKKMLFAGAKNPLIYIQNGKMRKLRGDKMPIGGEQREIERIFTSHQIDISQPATFYLFSDGFQDQFGGEKRKKFMTKRFRELLFEIHEKPMQEQQSILEETLANWMGKEEQIDDILVLGVKV